MKKFIILLPLFFLSSSNSLPDVKVDKTIYTVSYSQKLEQPLELVTRT